MSEVTPRDREEKLLAAIAEGTTGKLPTPRNRKEKLLKEIYDNGGTGGGGVTPAQVKTILLDNTDTALNGASSNPIANKALVAALADYVKSTDLSIPTKVSELINDKKYQTDSDLVTALTPYAKSDDVTAEIIAEIAKVVADAPEDFDTLKEMSDWIAGHEDDASAMNSAIQTNKSDIATLQTEVSNLPEWSKSATKPTYTKEEVGLGNVDNTADANKSVKYATSSGNATKVNNHTVKSDVPENAKFTDTIYDDTDIKAEIAKKADKTDIPTIGNGTITIKQAGTSKGTFTTNQTGNTTIELTDNNTTYSTGTASSSGLTKLYTETGTNTDGTMTQSAISSALKGKASTSVATTSANGLMSSSDKTKLNGIATGANNYTLPSSTSSVLGGVKLSDSTTVTNSTGLALPVTEKNPNVSGSLAAQISQLNTEKIQDVGMVTLSDLNSFSKSKNLKGIYTEPSGNQYVFLQIASIYSVQILFMNNSSSEATDRMCFRITTTDTFNGLKWIWLKTSAIS